MSARPFAVIVLLASMAGFGFAAVSTYDSVAHLDRQVHGIHCSYFLGMGKEDASGSSGCYATLMSPYSSVFRDMVWGGIPVALAGMSVFAFLVFWTSWMLLRDVFAPRAAGFLFLATLLPLTTSIVMGYLSFVDLDTVCKLCMGIYVSSAVAFVGAAIVYSISRQRRYRPVRGRDPRGRDPRGRNPRDDAPEVSWQLLFGAFGLGVLFVALPFGAFAAMAPDFSYYVGNCGTLRTSRDTEGVLLPYGPQDREVEMIEVLDPLCKACSMLERRVDAMPETRDVSRKMLLFPLDNACNWMVDEAIHPGACAVSEAVLCARKTNNVDQVLGWALAHQDEILEQTKQNPGAAAGIMARQFPSLQTCIGSASVRAKLNLALRWAVKNQLQVLTPQIFVRGLRLCDEDTDLGLDFALTRLIARARTAPPPREESLPADEPRPRPQRSAKVKTRPAGSTEPTSAKPPGESPAPPAESKGNGLDDKLDQVKDRIDRILTPSQPAGDTPPPSGSAPEANEAAAAPASPGGSPAPASGTADNPEEVAP